MDTEQKTQKPLADYGKADVTPHIAEYAQWLSEHTGYEVDPKSVWLSGVLRARWQQERKAEREAAEAKPKRRKKAQPTPKGSTVATKQGVVIAEQRHIDATREA